MHLVRASILLAALPTLAHADGLIAGGELTMVGHTQEHGSIMSFAPQVGWQTGDLVLSGTFIVDRFTVQTPDGDDAIYNEQIRAGLAWERRLPTLGLRLSVGLMFDPENDDFNSEDPLFGIDFDQVVYVPLAGSSTYFFGGIADFGGVAWLAIINGTVAGHGLSVAYADHEQGSDTITAMEVGFGVGFQASPELNVELGIPLADGFRSSSGGGDSFSASEVLFSDFYAMKLTGTFKAGSFDVGASLSLLNFDDDDQEDGGTYVRVGVFGTGRF